MPNSSYIESTFCSGVYEFKGLANSSLHVSKTNFSASSLKNNVETNTSSDIILCLHGWLDNAASFIPLFPHLIEHTVIAIDLIGHGHSPHRSFDAHYHFFDWVDDLLNLIQTQSWQRIHLVGHSMGGMVACALGAAFAEKVASITLLDVLGFICSDVENTTAQLQQGLLSRQKVKQKPLTCYENIERAVQTRMYMGDLTQASAELIVERGIEKTPEGYSWRADPRLHSVSPYRLTLSQAKQLLKDIKCPVQLLYGEQGYLSDGKAIKAFSDSIQGLLVTSFAGAHHFHMEEAEKTAKFIKAFVNKY